MIHNGITKNTHSRSDFRGGGAPIAPPLNSPLHHHTIQVPGSAWPGKGSIGAKLHSGSTLTLKLVSFMQTWQITGTDWPSSGSLYSALSWLISRLSLTPNGDWPQWTLTGSSLTCISKHVFFKSTSICFLQLLICFSCQLIFIIYVIQLLKYIMLMSICSSVLFMFGNENKLKLETWNLTPAFFRVHNNRGLSWLVLPKSRVRTAMSESSYRGEWGKLSHPPQLNQKNRRKDVYAFFCLVI